MGVHVNLLAIRGVGWLLLYLSDNSDRLLPALASAPYAVPKNLEFVVTGFVDDRRAISRVKLVSLRAVGGQLNGAQAEGRTLLRIRLR
jgi:hypothetical protein